MITASKHIFLKRSSDQWAVGRQLMKRKLTTAQQPTPTPQAWDSFAGWLFLGLKPRVFLFLFSPAVRQPRPGDNKMEEEDKRHPRRRLMKGFFRDLMCRLLSRSRLVDCSLIDSERDERQTTSNLQSFHALGLRRTGPGQGLG